MTAPAGRGRWLAGLAGPGGLGGRLGRRPDGLPELTMAGRRGTLPLWTLRLVSGLAVAGVLAALQVDGAPPGGLIVLGLVALSGLFVPASASAAVFIGGCALLLGVPSGVDPVRPPVLAVVVLGHLLHVSVGLLAVLPPKTRIHLSALRRPALRFAVVQAAVLGLAGLAAVLPGGDNPVLLELLAVVAVAGLAGLGIALLRRLAGRRDGG